MAHRWPVYDCLYLALALEQRCDLITADERFFNAIGPRGTGDFLLSELPGSLPGEVNPDDVGAGADHNASWMSV
jgi:hypothetical protein